ncbi:sensor histidine kinase [Leptobacterium flavescens]|nr:sensor histidine kinase [Leptobacterium flavescens]
MSKEVISLIVYLSLLILVLVTFVMFFFLSYQKRKNQLLIEKAEEKRRFEAELSKTQNEIQEQTFKNISWELHDNVGQLLSVAKMQLNMLQMELPENYQKRLSEASEVLGKGLSEMRQLSRTLNTDYVSNLGLQESLEVEVNRFKRLNFLRIEYDHLGDTIPINKKDEIIIFRIFQECFSNCIKYSKATLLSIVVEFRSKELFISATDNGVGFDMKKRGEGAGLINMRKRAELIGAKLTITSEINKGVSVTLAYPYKSN